MTHEERLTIAREVADAILRKHGKTVTAIAVYGSVARNQDAECSDLDMWVATKEPVEDVRFFVYRGLPISVNWVTEEAQLRLARTVSTSWPLEADERRSYLVLFEQGDYISRLREAVLNMPDESFVSAMQALMARSRETTNKILNAHEAGDNYRLLVEARLLTLSIAMMMGLANKRYYPGGRGLYQLSKQMARQPENYARLLDVVGGFAPSEPQVVYRSALELWESLCDFAEAEGLSWQYEQLPF